jgi:hypothetical protein
MEKGQGEDRGVLLDLLRNFHDSAFDALWAWISGSGRVMEKV